MMQKPPDDLIDELFSEFRRVLAELQGELRAHIEASNEQARVENQFVRDELERLRDDLLAITHGEIISGINEKRDAIQ